MRDGTLESIGNADARLLAVEISSVSSDQQCVVEACGGPDDGIGEFEFVFLAERNGFTSDSFVKFNHWKLPEKILPESSQYAGWRANKQFHPGDPADQDAIVIR